MCDLLWSDPDGEPDKRRTKWKAPVTIADPLSGGQTLRDGVYHHVEPATFSAETSLASSITPTTLNLSQEHINW